MRVPETPPSEAHSGGVLVLAGDTLLVPGPIAGAGLPGLIFVLADDSGDGFSLRGSGIPTIRQGAVDLRVTRS